MRRPLRRAFALSGVIGVGLGGLLSAGPMAVGAGSLICNVPHIDAVSPTVGNAGDTVTVSGSFGSPANAACTPSLSVGGTGVSLASHNNSTFTFTSPGANGPVVVTLTDVAGSSNSSNSNLIYGTVPRVSGLSPGNPVEGQAIGVSGSGFDFAGAPRPAVSATAFNGGSVCQPLGVRSRADNSISLDGTNRYCNGQVQVSFRLIVDTTPGHEAYQSVTVGAGSINVAPSVSSTSPGHGTPGTRLTVSGSGFGTGGSAAIGGVAAPAGWGDGAVAITVPSAAGSGAVTMVRANDGAQIAAGTFTVDSQIASVSPPAAAIGDTVTINGTGFGLPRGAVHLGGLNLPIVQWSPTSIRVTIPGGAGGGALTVLPVVNSAATAALAIVPRLGSVSPPHGQPGAPLLIRGSSLGARTGSVTIGGHAALVTLWADEQISLTVPDGVKPGPASIVATPPGGVAATIGFTVDAGALSPAAAAAALAAAGVAPPPIPPSAAGPLVTHGGPVDFHPQRKPPSPINLTLVPARDQADPGSDVALTATLIAYGKPVGGATIELVVVAEPGTDAGVTPARAVTDGRGQTHGGLHLSRTAGDHILLARSGLYSDEIRVRGGSDTALAGSTSSVVRRSVFWGVTAAVLLFVLGLAINLATSPGAALAGAGVWRQRPPGPRGMAVGAGRVALTVLRLAGEGWRATGRRALARLRTLQLGGLAWAARMRRLLNRRSVPPAPPV